MSNNEEKIIYIWVAHIFKLNLGIISYTLVHN